MMMKLIEHFVDEVGPDFAVLASADNLKDYVKSYFSGTLGAGLAYLKMAAEGYVWSDHFENLKGGNPACSRKPDYVFSGPSTGLALMEAKGSRSGTLKEFDDVVLDGYQGQVEPHLGHFVGGQIATRGYSIGAWMKSTTKAEFRLHHTAVPVSMSHGQPAAAQPSMVVQQHNFATAFTLVHSPELGRSLRLGATGELPQQIPFLRFQWLAERWVTGPFVPYRYWLELVGIPTTMELVEHVWPWYFPFRQPHLFALEERTAAAALRAFLGPADKAADLSPEIRPVGVDLREAARAASPDSIPGAVLPDGLALIGESWRLEDLSRSTWDRRDGSFK
jgi:hypothetical protein